MGDIFDDIERVERCDVVFCFGILYHINDHVRLLTKIAEAQPRWLIIDSNIAPHEDAIIELRNAMTGRRPPPGGQFEGYPSKAALDTMLSSFGWTMEYFDWAATTLVDDVVMSDYRKGDRVSVLVNCGEQYPEEVRAQAVRAAVRCIDTSPFDSKDVYFGTTDMNSVPGSLTARVYELAFV